MRIFCFIILFICFSTPAVLSNSTSPTQGKQAIEDVIMVTKTYYGLSGMYIDNVIYLLFKNGDVLFEPVQSPYELDIQKSKRERPDDWGTWSRQGSSIHIKWGDGEEEQIDDWFVTRPAINQQTLSGKFKSSDAFGGSLVHNFNTVSFSDQNEFAWKNLKGGPTSWRPIYSESTTAGTYTLNEFEITLNYNNGETEKFIFFYYPEKQDYFGIGTNDFVPSN